MCGICGFNWASKKLVKQMASVIAHRGPDASGFFVDDNVSLGHLRLSIIDLSARGKQPMESHDGSLQIVYNGEVYNHKEIRVLLEKKGYKFRSDTDTEVIVNAYQEYGADCVKMFNGMFSFAIWDASAKKLFLARDRMGIKPLYYWFDGENFAFASEIKALLELGIERSVSPSSFEMFMNFRFVVGPQTMFKGVYKLLPGHTLTLYAGKMPLVKKYWDVRERIVNKSLSYFSAKLRKMLAESVEKRLMSDVPLGVYLSGGIDSSSMVGLMTKMTSDIKTFSVGFGNSVENEYSSARIVAEHFGTDHHEVAVTDKHLSLLDKMVYHMDEPIGDAATLPTYVISSFAKKKVTVVLAGEGADEQFAGYDRYKMMLYGNMMSKMVPSVVKSNVLKRFQTKRVNLQRAKELVASKGLGEQYMKAISLFDSSEVKSLGVSRSSVVKDVLQERLIRSPVKKTLNKIMYFDQKTLLPDDFFMKADKMTMAHSVEERVPFLDHNIVEFSFTIPTRYKMRGWNEKYVLKKAMSSVLPKATVKRKKRGYNAPMDSWLRGELGEKLSGLLDVSSHGLYDVGKVSGMLRDFRKSTGNYKRNWFASQKLWSMLMFEMWWRRFICEED